MPAFAARLAFGQMADELLLAGQRVRPTKLLDRRLRFKFPISSRLQHVLYPLSNGVG